MTQPLQKRDASQLDPAVEAARAELDRVELEMWRSTLILGRDYFGDLDGTEWGRVPVGAPDYWDQVEARKRNGSSRRFLAEMQSMWFKHGARIMKDWRSGARAGSDRQNPEGFVIWGEP